MQSCEVLIVGGGPAGSSAAWKLKAAGVDVRVLDKEAFPRLKLCAGWITPEVVRDLELDIDAYPHRFLTFETMQVHIKGLRLPLPCVQHSIRREEFDAWLLARSGAPVMQHTVKSIREEDGGYVIDETFRCRHLIGAGGTRCPVYRSLFRDVSPRLPARQIVALEHELEHPWRDPDCHLWFFDHGLPGYAWYVPKENGWVNLGIGGMAEQLKQGSRDIKEHWSLFCAALEAGPAAGARPEASGYSYYVRGPADTVRIGNAFITGDAAGLATRDLGEGIGPAIASGLRAAESILHGTVYRLDDVAATSWGGLRSSILSALGRRLLLQRKGKGRGRVPAPVPVAAARPGAAQG
jgi:flavin-dependent dehydrogenase